MHRAFPPSLAAWVSLLDLLSHGHQMAATTSGHASSQSHELSGQMEESPFKSEDIVFRMPLLASAMPQSRA